MSLAGQLRKYLSVMHCVCTAASRRVIRSVMHEESRCLPDVISSMPTSQPEADAGPFRARHVDGVDTCTDYTDEHGYALRRNFLSSNPKVSRIVVSKTLIRENPSRSAKIRARIHRREFAATVFNFDNSCCVVSFIPVNDIKETVLICWTCGFRTQALFRSSRAPNDACASTPPFSKALHCS